MNAREFFYLTSQMRDAQKSYFRTRDRFDLKRARMFENQVDKEIERVKDIIRASEMQTEELAQ